jgi:hypothetical protein
VKKWKRFQFLGHYYTLFGAEMKGGKYIFPFPLMHRNVSVIEAFVVGADDHVGPYHIATL